MTKRESATKLSIARTASLYEAMERLNQCTSTRTLLVVDENDRLVGTLTDGDIRRYVCAQHENRQERPNGQDDILRDFVFNAVPQGEDWFPPVRDNESLFASITRERHWEHLHPGRRLRVIPIVDGGNQVIDILDLLHTRQRPRLEIAIMRQAFPIDELTHEDIEKRRLMYDENRYRHQIFKYKALARIAQDQDESDAIKNEKRIDELYMALKRGQEWTYSFLPTDEEFREELMKLRAEVDAAVGYVNQWLGREGGYGQTGDQTAYDDPDYIFVLGCQNVAEQTKRLDAMMKFVDRCSNNLPKLIVLSGGGKDSKMAEADQMKKKLGDHTIWWGKYGHLVVLETDALDTVGNAIFGLLTLRLKNIRDFNNTKICIFTSDYHANRSLGLFQRVFHASDVGVRYVPRDKTDTVSQYESNLKGLESEYQANTQTFGLEDPVTGMPQPIAEGHIRSLFFQLLRSHKMYQHRSDLVRKYREGLLDN